MFPIYFLSDGDENCIICSKSLGNGTLAVISSQKGLQTLMRSMKARNDDKVFFLRKRLHKQCRQEYCNQLVIERDRKRKLVDKQCNAQSNSPGLKSKKSRFCITTDCIFCGVPVSHRSDLKDRVSEVKTLDFDKTTLRHCSGGGPNDPWAQTIKGRIHSIVTDVRAADAVYHISCFRTFEGKTSEFLWHIGKMLALLNVVEDKRERLVSKNNARLLLKG